MTFNAAHQYLGLTAEVLRTEKAINDIACHPLPASFYEGGGLQYLRHRFDGANSSPTEDEGNYFGDFSESSTAVPSLLSKDSSSSSLGKSEDRHISKNRAFNKKQSSPLKTPRHMVQAGDLFVPKGHASEIFRPLTRSYSILSTPRLSRSSDMNYSGHDLGTNHRISTEDFDLREEVMSCIAKSIGLLQPPLSGMESAEASPHIPPTDYRRSEFDSPFSSLSLLNLGDDASSTAGASSVTSTGDYMSGLDNEVEILFFPGGSTLAKAGESNTGNLLLLYHIITLFSLL